MSCAAPALLVVPDDRPVSHSKNVGGSECVPSCPATRSALTEAGRVGAAAELPAPVKGFNVDVRVRCWCERTTLRWYNAYNATAAHRATPMRLPMTAPAMPPPLILFPDTPAPLALPPPDEGAALELGDAVGEFCKAPDAFGVRLGCGVRVGVPDTVGKAVCDGGAVPDGSGVGASVPDGRGLSVACALRLGVADRVACGVRVGVPDTVACAVCDGGAVPDGSGVGASVPDGRGLSVACAVREGDVDVVACALRLGVADRVACGVRVGVPDAVGKAVCDGGAEPEGSGVGAAVPDARGDTVAWAVRVGNAD